MISYNSKNWFSFLFITKGSLMDRLLPGILFITLITVGLCYAQLEKQWLDISISNRMHGLVGIVLGLLLVFRTNSAYDRWWEGRKVLGAQVNTCRNFAIKLNALIDKNKIDERTTFVRLISSFNYLMRDHLHVGIRESTLNKLSSKEQDFIKSVKNKPTGVANMMYDKLHEYFKNGLLSGEQLIIYSRHVDDLIDILGKCERIKKTPIPLAYALLLKRFVLVYVATLPFGVIHDLGWASLPAVIVVFYVMVGVEVIGEEIEDPFGDDANDLPISEIAINIEKDISDLLLHGSEDAANIITPDARVAKLETVLEGKEKKTWWWRLLHPFSREEG